MQAHNPQNCSEIRMNAFDVSKIQLNNEGIFRQTNRLKCPQNLDFFFFHDNVQCKAELWEEYLYADTLLACITLRAGTYLPYRPGADECVAHLVAVWAGS